MIIKQGGMQSLSALAPEKGRVVNDKGNLRWRFPVNSFKYAGFSLIESCILLFFYDTTLQSESIQMDPQYHPSEAE